MHDLVIRGANIVDGTGVDAYVGDLAVDSGIISSVGGTAGQATREILADGAMVSPGWVDVHTHYDGQVTWDPIVGPSSWHGVTSIVMGNCGVGFAPVKPADHNMLIELMEGVEDIPGTALSEGIQWDWESFPEYLNALDSMPRALDVATQIPHGAVRTYVMGDRGAKNEKATTQDIEEMAGLVKEGLKPELLAFRRLGRFFTAPRTVRWCRGPTRKTKKCWESAGPWAKSVMASLKSPVIWPRKGTSWPG